MATPRLLAASYCGGLVLLYRAFSGRPRHFGAGAVEDEWSTGARRGLQACSRRWARLVAELISAQMG